MLRPSPKSPLRRPAGSARSARPGTPASWSDGMPQTIVPGQVIDVDFNHRCGDIRNAFSDVGGHVILGPKLFWFRSLLVWISRFRRLLKVLFAFLLLSLEAMHLVHKFG